MDNLKQNKEDNESLWKASFFELMRNKTAFVSLVVILLFTFASIFAYLIISDNTPNANNQYPEIPLKKAGYSVSFLKTETDIKVDNAWHSWLTGFNKSYSQVPFETIKYGDDGVTLTLNGRDKIVSYENLPTAVSSLRTLEDKKEYINKQLVTKRTFWLGTDKYGRSVLSRLVLGVRVSLFAGFLAVLVSLLIGVTVGALGGFYGGWIDGLVMYFVNVTWAIPTLLLVFAIVLALGRGMGVVFLAIGLTMWVDVARIVRGQVMETKNMLFVQAARAIGQSDFMILVRHILPNIIGPILVITAANFATAILIEAGLSYLGFGINPPTPSLGNTLNENYGYALSGNLVISFAPAIVVSLLVLCFNLLGTGLRDVFDVRKVEG